MTELWMRMSMTRKRGCMCKCMLLTTMFAQMLVTSALKSH